MALIDVISYEGNKEVLVYKHPRTEFNTLSQLIVYESQEAVFFKDGKMLDTLGPGKHTLHTGNIPLLSNLINLPTGGESPFQCEVYFINKALALNYKWGTTSLTKVIDPKFNLLLDMGASGILGMKVINPRMLVGKIVGTESILTAEECLNYFRENISARVKEYLARVMSKPEMSFPVLERYLSDFSRAIKELLQEVFMDVGVEIYNFVISRIIVPEEQYAVITQGMQKNQEAEFRKRQAEIDSQARANSRRIEGYNWADEQIAEITKLYAANEGNSQNPANMLAQAPIAFAFGNMLRDNMDPLMGMKFSVPSINFSNDRYSNTPNESKNMFADITSDNYGDVSSFDDEKLDDKENNNISEVKGKELNTENDPIEILAKLKKMVELGLVSQERYDKKLEEILEKMG